MGSLPAGGDLVELPEAVILDNESFNASEFAIYPNPTSNILNLKGLDNSDFSIQIVDMQGRILTTDFNMDGSGSMDVSTLASGLYHLIISNENRIIAIKAFVKQ